MADWTRNRAAVGCRCAKPLFRVVGVVVLSWLGCLQPARATTVIEHSFSSLVQAAEMIAIGTVTAVESEWNADKEAPFTLVTFSNLEVLKGDGSQTELTLHFLGGPTPDGLIMQIAGVPSFSLGERNVIFCIENQHRAVPLVGIWQGMYRVVFDAERGLETIHNHAGQPVTALPTEGGGILHAEAPLVQEQHEAQPAAMSLETLTQMIEREVRQETLNEQ